MKSKSNRKQSSLEGLPMIRHIVCSFGLTEHQSEPLHLPFFFGGVGKHCFNLGVQIVSVGDIPDVVGDSFTLVFQEHLPNRLFFSTHWSSDSVFVDITIYVASILIFLIFVSYRQKISLTGWWFGTFFIFP